MMMSAYSCFPVPLSIPLHCPSLLSFPLVPLKQDKKKMAAFLLFQAGSFFGANGVAVPVGVLKEASSRFFWKKTGAPQSFPQQEKKSGGEQLSWCLNASATLDTVGIVLTIGVA